jgi:hypothetical protein
MKLSLVTFPITVSAFVALLALAASTASGQSFTRADALKYPAYAASPRAIEAFPWLTRTSTQPTAAATVSVPAAVTDNASFATSPRVRELYPQLGRPVPVLTKSTTPEILNAAYAASPRAKELYPWLTRGGQTFEVAPLK